MSKYTWIVTQDSVLGDSSDAVGKIGPSGAKGRARFDTIITHGERFRMRNGAGEVQFVGYIVGEFTGAEPLEDYGLDNGCAMVEYEREGHWISLAEFTSLRATAIATASLSV